MNELPINILEIAKLIGLGYLVGDILELQIAKLQRGRTSVIAIMIVFIIILGIGMVLGKEQEKLKEILKPYTLQAGIFLAGFFLGLYREKVVRSRY